MTEPNSLWSCEEYMAEIESLKRELEQLSAMADTEEISLLARAQQAEAKLAEMGCQLTDTEIELQATEKERDNLKGRFSKAVREWQEEVELADQRSTKLQRALEEARDNMVVKDFLEAERVIRKALEDE